MTVCELCGKESKYTIGNMDVKSACVAGNICRKCNNEINQYVYDNMPDIVYTKKRLTKEIVDKIKARGSK